MNIACPLLKLGQSQKKGFKLTCRPVFGQPNKLLSHIFSLGACLWLIVIILWYYSMQDFCHFIPSFASQFKIQNLVSMNQTIICLLRMNGAQSIGQTALFRGEHNFLTAESFYLNLCQRQKNLATRHHLRFWIDYMLDKDNKDRR